MAGGVPVGMKKEDPKNKNKKDPGPYSSFETKAWPSCFKAMFAATPAAAPRIARPRVRPIQKPSTAAPTRQGIGYFWTVERALAFQSKSFGRKSNADSADSTPPTGPSGEAPAGAG